MNKEKIIEKCEMIYSVFDDLRNPRTGCEVRDGQEIRDLIYDLLDEDKRAESILGEAYQEKEDDLVQLENEFCMVSFAFGYVIGNLFDSPHPKVESAVKSIQALLKEKALLPYFPREKREKKAA